MGVDWTEEQRIAFASLWRTARQGRAYKQWEVAQAVDISQSVVSMLERGPSPNMRYTDIVKLADFYGIPLHTVNETLGLHDHETAFVSPPWLRAAATQLSPKHRGRLRWLLRVAVQGMMLDEQEQKEGEE